MDYFTFVNLNYGVVRWVELGHNCPSAMSVHPLHQFKKLLTSLKYIQDKRIKLNDFTHCFDMSFVD